MNKKTILLLAVLSAFLIVSGRSIILLHTNDIMDVFEPRGATFINPDFPPKLGGVYSFATAVKWEREKAEKNGDILLLTDSGNFSVKHLKEDSVSMDRAVTVFNYLGYDIINLGIDEISSGPRFVERNIEKLNMPVLLSNISFWHYAQEKKILTLDNILFDFKKASLRPESYIVIDSLAKIMEKTPDIKVEISGHTDTRGSQSHNNKLSEARSQSVKNYLVEHHNIDPARIITISYGEDRPIVHHEKTEADYQKNRRVEFKMLSYKLDERVNINLNVKDYHIFDIEGIRIGVFGLTTEYAVFDLKRHVLEQADIEREITTAKRLVNLLKKNRCHIIIGLTSIGFEHDKKLADTVEGIDIILGGYEGRGMREPYETPVNHTVIFKGYGELSSYEKIVLELDELNYIKGYSGESVTLFEDAFPPDPEMKNKLQNED